MANFLSVKPHRALSQELKQGWVLVGQIENHEILSQDVEHMNPHEVMEHPACGRGLDALAFLVWKRRPVFLERAANAVRSGGIDEQTDGHHHQQGPDAFGFFERARRGQQLGGFEEAKAACGIRLPCVSGQHHWRWHLGLVQVIRGEDETTVLVDKRLTGCAPRRQGSSDIVDDLVRLGAMAWTPPLPLSSTLSNYAA